MSSSNTSEESTRLVWYDYTEHYTVWLTCPTLSPLQTNNIAGDNNYVLSKTTILKFY